MVNPLPSQFPRRRRPRSGGFTLIEVLVVIIIAAVLAGIAAPGWLAFLNRQRVTAVKSDLVQTLKKAQSDAIQRRQEVAVEIVTPATAPTVKVGKPQLDPTPWHAPP